MSDCLSFNRGVTLDSDTCYRAVIARDPRFDGRFFTGVTSTGIYCRPICPARTPARRNMRFFPHAGAAEAAGFRACRRCRPEASPGSPDWNARADLAARAVRLIADGYADEHRISGLARRLAVTDRHLRRLLLAELGATPIALARTTRLQTARRLLAETGMQITEIAFASGFSSVRQFNASFQEAYGRPPSALRSAPPRSRTPRSRTPRSRTPRSGTSRSGTSLSRTSRPRVPRPSRPGQALATGLDGPAGPGAAGELAPGEPAASGTWLTLRLACREPFDGQSLLRFLAARAIAGVEAVSPERYARTVRVPGGSGLIELVPPPARRDGGEGQAGRAAHRAQAGQHGRARQRGQAGEAQVLLRVRLTSLRGVGQVVSRCRRVFDLDADPQAIAAALAADEALAPLVAARPGLRVPGAYDGFELAVRAVLGQQVSVRGASTLAGRLAARHGTPVDAPPDPAGQPGSGAPGAGPAAGPAGAPGPLTVLFPRPAELADADLSGLGLTTGRQVTLRTLAAACATGALSLDPGADPEETAARLAELPGVGPWTVAYIMMRGAGDPDAFPGSDLGLRRAMARLGLEPGHAGRWRPWRAYAAVHLWAALAEPAALSEPATLFGPATAAVPRAPAIPRAPAGRRALAARPARATPPAPAAGPERKPLCP
jgi:AraC family transcriptional regulator, regulatory protein of adaptative response / DNA-3-methyladenine glycosylase II